ncbi:MAG: dicarboxylate/amino acid:cation symporter [Phycisphaeraceae bacterium]|nr:dicarboxylate/amino acid:cation symporter [Phycisphaeraceae bacterium]
MSRGNLLTVLILAGLAGGVILGQVLYLTVGKSDPAALDWLRQAGDLVLIRPLMLMIIPLVFASVVVGVTSLGDPSKLGRVGGATLLYYFATMLIAVALGAVLVTTIAPGVGLPPEQVAALRAEGERSLEARQDLQSSVSSAEALGVGGAWMNILHQMVPTNLLHEMSANRPLGVIVAALLFGLALAATGERARPVVDFFNALFAGLMVLVGWIIWLTPIGVLLLVGWTVGTIGLSALVGPLSMYMLVVLVGLFIHGALILPLVLRLFGRTNPYRFMWQMRRALMTAFGTDSSSATLPVTIQTAETEGKCSKRSANFVLPLGATINMDGTALYEAVAVVFLFQLFGIDLSMTELVIVVITATLAAVGAAGIPSAGLVTMVIVITAVNRSLAGRGVEALPIAAIGILLGVDRILDMCRTVVNVWGDAVGAKIMTRLAPDADPPAR